MDISWPVFLEFITVEGEKMSKTIGNVIDPFALVKKYGVEAVRYFLLSEIPSDKDGDFSYKKLEERYNGDLANGLGNLVSRVATLIDNNMDSELIYEKKLISDDIKKEVNFLENYSQAIEAFELHGALDVIWSVIFAANKYIDDRKPWVELKEDPTRFLETMTNLAYMIHNIAWSLQPFLPETSDKIARVFGGNLSDKEIHDEHHFIVKKGEPLFPRI